MAEVKKSKEKVEDAEVEKAVDAPVDAEVEKTEATPEKKKYTVETPVANYNGEVAGVQFAYGKAEVYEGHILDWFKKHGYKVTAL